MRKFLTLFSALLLTVSMWGANEYNATINGDVTLTDLSYDLGGFMVYKYQLDFAQVGQTVGKTDTWNSEVRMILEPLEEGLAGTYTLSDNSMSSDSYVYYSGATRYVCDYNSGDIHKLTEIVITDNQDGSYTISGAFRTKNGKNYYYYYFDATDPKNTFTPVAPDPYEEEPAKGADITFNGNSLYSKSFTDNILELDITDAAYNEIILDFNATQDNLAAGSYAVGTDIVASTGMDGYWPIPSYFYTSGLANYFIVGGSLTISYSEDSKKLLMVGDLITGHGTTIKVNNEVDNPWSKDDPTGLETSSAALKANKVLKNGQLMLFKGDKVYNAQAQEL